MSWNGNSKRSFLRGLGLAGIFLVLPAWGAPPRCFLHGIITPASDNKEKTSLSDMIRLNFDANEEEKCKQMMSAYCQYNVKDKNYSPTRLKGSFKPDAEKSAESVYRFNEKCKLLTDED
jgi:hypothetical protein